MEPEAEVFQIMIMIAPGIDALWIDGRFVACWIAFLGIKRSRHRLRRSF